MICRGTDELLGVTDRVHIINSTLGKALGGAAGMWLFKYNVKDGFIVISKTTCHQNENGTYHLPGDNIICSILNLIDVIFLYTNDCYRRIDFG